LTQLLLETGANVTVIEIDKNMTDFLKRYLFFYHNLKIIHKDFLEVTPEELDAPITFIGNLPYNVSVKIIQKCIDMIDKIELMVFMFQKEVADRISSKPGSKTYSSLSVYCQYFFDIKKIKHFSGGNFWPKTKVFSTILKFTPKERYFKNLETEKQFLEFIEKAFKNKRKTIKNNFPNINLEEILIRLFNKPTIRAEELTLEDFIKLFETLYVR
jgi:16S rRNA (adenine1518-N6/adenine1519-N6)-dimethyltransferase